MSSLIIFATKEYITSSAFRGMYTSTLVTCYVKRDSDGVILDPSSMHFKCGWGNSIPEAVTHFMSRNPDVLYCETKLF